MNKTDKIKCGNDTVAYSMCDNMINPNTATIKVYYMCCYPYACYDYEDKQFCSDCLEALKEENEVGYWKLGIRQQFDNNDN